jgi:hypothetical protein
VLFIHHIINSPRIGIGKHGPQRWTKDRFNHFLSIRARLSGQRAFAIPIGQSDEPLPPRPKFDGPSLFGTG